MSFEARERFGARLASGVTAQLAGMVLLAAISVAARGPRRVETGPAPGISPRLRELAARADRESDWPPLRRYAASLKDPEQRGLAYLVLGYHEYQADDYPAAGADLGRAASAPFSLADFATYYQADAAQAAHQPEQAAAALKDFSARYPESLLHWLALGLEADALLKANQPDQAIGLLAAEPQSSGRAPLALLLGRGYWQAHKLPEAARAFEHVYDDFPAAPESDVAADALKEIKAQLGDAFPAATEDDQAHRVELLLKAGRYGQALKDYSNLLEGFPSSPWVPRWSIDRARCLIHLRRYRDAVDALAAAFKQSPELDAERLATLVDAYARLDDPESMLIVLTQLHEVYPASSWYQAAMSRAGAFYVARGDWPTAAKYYQPIADAQPPTGESREAEWRTAWAAYLASDDERARAGFEEHLTRYPDSPHAAAALYWLGRLEEEQGSAPEARADYALVERRFVDGYYPLQASLRLKSLKTESGDAASRPSSRGSALLASSTAPSTPLPENVPPRPPPPVGLCAQPESSASLRPFATLEALGLDDLAERGLRLLLAKESGSAAALGPRIALTRLEADRGKTAEVLFEAKKLAPDYYECDFPELPKEVWDWLYPRNFWSLVERQARANRLDPYLVMAVIRQESAFDPRATSAANARGLMQVLPGTASPAAARPARGRRRTSSRQRAAQRLYDPAYNVRVACRYLAELIRSYHGDLEEALAAYNAGDFRADTWLKGRNYREPAEFVESIPFRETRLYVEAVMRDAGVYRRLLSGSPRFLKCAAGPGT